MTRVWLCVLLLACIPSDCAAPAREPEPTTARPPAVKVAPAPPPAPRPARIEPTRGHVTVGSRDACVRTATGGVACWGSSSSPVVVPGLAHVAGVVNGQSTSCAWTVSGEVWCRDGDAPVKLAGIDDAVELAIDPDYFNMCARRRTGRVACRSDFDKPGTPVTDTVGVAGAKAIAVAGTTACIRDDTRVACWSTRDEAPTLHEVPEAAGATSIAAGRFTFVALRPGKPPVAWNEERKPVALPVIGGDVFQIALGGDQACALGKTVHCWDIAKPATLHEVPGLAGANEIAVGYGVACAQVGDRALCWGSVGLLGNGIERYTAAPTTLVSGLTDAVKLTSDIDAERACARRATGATVCWGAREGTHTDKVPVADRVKIALGPTRSWSGSYQRGAWTCTRRNHKVTCEETFYGRHQDVSTGPEETWGYLDDARDIKMPSNSNGDVCVADAAGAVSCFPAFEGASRADAVSDVSDVIQLAGTGEQTCALEASGSVKCWNERERRYQGSEVKPLPVKDVVEIASGSVQMCVRYRNGTVGCWGLRSLLGDGADDHQDSPIAVPGATL
jgi:hypothetical protein